MKKATIVIPTFNEVKNVDELIDKVIKVTEKIPRWELDILIVDSMSPDKTGERIKKLAKKHSNLHLLEVKKEGLGRAYTQGFSYAIKNLEPQVLFEMDADLSHNSTVIPEFLKAIEEGADFVIGSRYIKGGSIPSNWGFHRKALSIVGNIIIRLGFMKPRITDWTSGYRAIKTWIVKDALPHINKYSGYVFQVAFLDFALKKRAIVHEIPIQFTDRRFGLSKINSIQYTLQTLWYTFIHSSFVRYILVGLTGFVLDFGLSFVFIERLHSPLWLATIVSAECAIISNFIFNNFWSFSHKKLEAKTTTYAKQFVKFNTIASGSLVIQAAGIEGLAAFFGRKWWFIYKVFILGFIVIPYSYILYNKLIWKDKRNS